jgi:uncharacterized DUF497 family protein
MNITFDPAKRAKTLEERGLDFADADQVFASVAYTIEDDRLPYPEPRFITFGDGGVDPDAGRTSDYLDEESQ